MDTASLIGALGSVDVMSAKPVLLGLEGIISSVFSGITGSIDTGVAGSAGISSFIQGALGSLGGI